jgi:hypothetical protein
MVELITAFASWPSLLLLIVLFGFAPGLVLRLLLRLYPADDLRRKELLAELYGVPRWERPFWVAEQLETALCEAIPHRARRARDKRAQSANQRVAKLLKSRADRSGYGIGILHVQQQAAVLDALSAITSGARVAFTGAPWTGKTVCSRLITRQLLDEPVTERWGVPVWIAMRDWNPDATSCEEFIAGEIRKQWGMACWVARKLVKKGRVIPIFDGFDELRPEHRTTAVDQLNRQWPDRPMVITCRQRDVMGLAGLADADNFAHVHLSLPFHPDTVTPEM